MDSSLLAQIQLADGFLLKGPLNLRSGKEVPDFSFLSHAGLACRTKLNPTQG